MIQKANVYEKCELKYMLKILNLCYLAYNEMTLIIQCILVVILIEKIRLSVPLETAWNKIIIFAFILHQSAEIP